MTRVYCVCPLLILIMNLLEANWFTSIINCVGQIEDVNFDLYLAKFREISQ